MLASVTLGCQFLREQLTYLGLHSTMANLYPEKGVEAQRVLFVKVLKKVPQEPLSTDSWWDYRHQSSLLGTGTHQQGPEYFSQQSGKPNRDGEKNI